MRPRPRCFARDGGRAQARVSPAASNRRHLRYFPSSHAAGSLALVAALAFLAWSTRWRWLVLALSIALVVLYGAALVYTRSHYPSDVVGGWCVALFWTCGFALLVSSADLRPGLRRRERL